MYCTAFREGRDWCTVQYLDRERTHSLYSISRLEGLVFRRVFREG
jgi:hypothetical protein